MEPILVGLASLLIGFLMGAGLIWILRTREITRLAATLSAQEALVEQSWRETATASAELERWRLKAEEEGRTAAAEAAKAARVGDLERQIAGALTEIAKVTAEKGAIEAIATEQAAATRRQIEALTQLREEMLKDFQHLAGQALRSNEESFLKLANETFEKHKVAAVADVDQRKEAITALLQPVTETLARYEKGLSEIEKARQESYGNLTTELKNVIQTQVEVRSETSKLVNALRAAPKTRGRWGEEALRNVMELSGMSAHCDFTTEETFDRDDMVLRPDAIIRLPGERFIVVDSKTSMSGYLDAVDATDDTSRELHLDRHAKQVRQHMRALSAKSYWDGLTVTPDFVAMFIPGENFFAAAMERDAALFDDAVKGRVLIVTPTTLIALAKAVAFGWRQEKVAENAAIVADLGRELYKRLSTMGDNLVAMGKALEKTVTSYNGFVGSLEGSVLPQARRFNDLHVEGTAGALPQTKLIETDVREPRRDRDLVIADGGSSMPVDQCKPLAIPPG